MTATTQQCSSHTNTKYRNTRKVATGDRVHAQAILDALDPTEKKPMAIPTGVKAVEEQMKEKLEKLGYKISDILAVVEEEQKLTMEYAKMGYKVIKKNYLTIEGRKMEGKKAWKSPLTGKIYDIPAKTRILVRVGDGFKRYIENKKMPDKLCRFVDSGASTPTATSV